MREPIELLASKGTKKKSKPKKQKEETHRKKLMTSLRAELPSAVSLRHEDDRTAGIPDISVTVADPSGPCWNPSRVVWLECKAKSLDAFKTEVAGPKVSKKIGLQREILRRLGGFYIVFDSAIMWIVEPTDLSVVSRFDYDPATMKPLNPYREIALFVKGLFI